MTKHLGTPDLHLGSMHLELNPDTYYMQPDLPSVPFMIEDQHGDVDGPYEPDGWVPDDHGVMMYQDGAHPIFLRTLAQMGNSLIVLDGDGAEWTYKLHPLATLHA